MMQFQVLHEQWQSSGDDMDEAVEWKKKCDGCLMAGKNNKERCRRCSRNYTDRYLEDRVEEYGTAKTKNKLSARDVEIRKRYVEERKTYEDLALEYGISKQRVAQIVCEMRTGSKYRGSMVCRAKTWRNRHGKSVAWIAKKLRVPPMEVMEMLGMTQRDITVSVKSMDSRKQQAN